LLQRAIAEASMTSFTVLKTVIWGDGSSPLNELLSTSLWEWVRQGSHPSNQPPLVLISDEKLLPDQW
jgi:hypothetical protein